MALKQNELTADINITANDNVGAVTTVTNEIDNFRTFTNHELGTIRTVTINGEPWFCGKDIAVALGYKDSDKALRDHVSNKYKLIRQISGSGQVRNMIFINEAGLYKLVFKSKLPSAEKFSDWTCEEVIPSIRKTGMYMTRELSPREILKQQLALMIENDEKLAKQDQRLTVVESTVSSLTETIEDVQQTATVALAATEEISQRLDKEIQVASSYDIMLDVDHAKTKEKVRNLESEVLDIKDQLVDITSLPKSMGLDIRACVNNMVLHLQQYQGLPERQAHQRATEDLLGDISVEAGHTRDYISQERKRRRDSLIRQGLSDSTAKRRITCNTIVDTDPTLKIATAKVIQSYNRTLATLKDRLIL